MSTKVLCVQLAELDRFRVICQACKKGVIEVPLDGLNGALHKGKCRLCQHHIFPETDPANDPLADLQRAIDDLKRLKVDIVVEFEIPSPN